MLKDSGSFDFLMGQTPSGQSSFVFGTDFFLGVDLIILEVFFVGFLAINIFSWFINIIIPNHERSMSIFQLTATIPTNLVSLDKTLWINAVLCIKESDVTLCILLEEEILGAHGL